MRYINVSELEDLVPPASVEKFIHFLAASAKQCENMDIIITFHNIFGIVKIPKVDVVLVMKRFDKDIALLGVPELWKIYNATFNHAIELVGGYSGVSDS